MDNEIFRDVVVDATPLSRGHSTRGIGVAVRGLFQGLREVLPADERPRTLVTHEQTPLPGFAHAAVTWPKWKLERLPDLWPRISVERDVKKLRSSLFHCTQHELVPNPRRARVVATCYDLIPYHFPPGAVRRRAWIVRKNMDRMRDAAAVCCFSRAIAEEIHDVLNVPRDRIRVIPLAPAASPTPEGGAHPRPFVLYANSLDAHKNPRLAVDAIAACHHDLDLVVAGVSQAPLRADLMEYAARRGVADRIVMVGYVSDAVLAGLRHHAVAVLVPSRREGFGLPAIEAMAAGTPVVISRTPVLEETAGAGAMVCGLDAPDEWGNALDRIREDDAFRRDLIARGHDHAEKFTWERTAEATLGVWRSVL